jgi:Ca-activated chloride channel family protein
MSFASPFFLFGLALVPVAVGAYALARRRRRRYAVRYTGVPLLATLAGSQSAWRRRVPLALFLAALAALSAALARPQATVAVPLDGAAVVLVSDASGSMEAEDVEPSRLDATREAAHGFLDQIPDGLRVGIVGFSSSPNTVAGPTTDLDEVRDPLDGLAAGGSTATGDALAVALSMMREPTGEVAPGAIVLLSDGRTTSGRDPSEVAERARRLGVPVHTVSLGTPEGIVPTAPGSLMRVPPDPQTMREIARLSRGESFTVDEGDELARLYERLGSEIGSRDEVREITAAFAGGGLLLLISASALAVRWRGRLP